MNNVAITAKVIKYESTSRMLAAVEICIYGTKLITTIAYHASAFVSPLALELKILFKAIRGDMSYFTMERGNKFWWAYGPRFQEFIKSFLVIYMSSV